MIITHIYHKINAIFLVNNDICYNNYQIIIDKYIEIYYSMIERETKARVVFRNGKK